MDPKEPSIEELIDEGCYVALTDGYLNAQAMMDKVRSPQAGAIVLFAGLYSKYPISSPIPSIVSSRVIKDPNFSPVFI
jgi:hypothetical protein